MYHKILVPLDGSPRAEKVLAYVEELAHHFGATVVLLHVIERLTTVVSPHGVVPYDDDEMMQQWNETAKTYLAKLYTELSNKGIEVKTCLEKGSVVSSILYVAESEQVDLIALASHGRTGLARIFYGSVAAGILNQADRPLLLIRTQA